MLSKLLRALKNGTLKLRLFRAFLLILQFMRKSFYLLLSTNKPISNHMKLHQPALFSGLGKIKFGNSNIGVWPSPKFLSSYAHIEARSSTALIEVGDNCWLSNNATIISDRSPIIIGDNVLIGHDVFITDSDFHGLEPENRLNGLYETKPVVISNNVFIGASVKILKGVTIGENSVVASGAVVVSSVPSNVIVGGVPAKIIRRL